MSPYPQECKQASKQAKLWHKLKQLKSNISGNFGIIFALSAMPIILSIGMAIDYSTYSTSKAKLDSAMDSAVLAGVTATKSYLANNKDLNLAGEPLYAAAKEAGEATSLKLFNAHLKSDERISNFITNTIITATNTDVTANITYSADYKLAFGSLIRLDTFKVINSAQATVGLPVYLDISIVMDVSASMSIGADQANIDKLIATPGINCEFACHTAGANLDLIAHANGIRLRIDVMRDAITNILSQAQAISKGGNDYQFRLYTFSEILRELQFATTDYPTLFNAMNNLAFPDWGGGTNFTYSIGTMLPPLLNTSKDGNSPTARKTHVIIVTDGIEDLINRNADGSSSDPNFVYQPESTYSASDPYPKNLYFLAAFNPTTTCDSLKAKGATVSVLLINYTTVLTTPSNYEYDEVITYIKERILPNASSKIKDCASIDPVSGMPRFYSANSTDETLSAAKAIFQQITSRPARLIN